MKKKLLWLKLDNAANIYPAARNRSWTNIFRLSVTFNDEIDPQILQSSLDRVVLRFPSLAARLRTGLFWYYIEQIPKAPAVINEGDVTFTRMTFSDIKKCAFRVLYYKNRMSVEIFHSMTDGNGGLVFVKTLAAEYVRERYGENVPCDNGILDLNEKPKATELEDSFNKYVSTVNPGWSEPDAYQLKGTREEDGLNHIVSGTLEASEIIALAKSYGVTVTTFLAAVMMKSIYDIQNEKVPNRKKRKNVKVLIPVNLRKLLPSETMRNFAQYITPEIDPRLGDYTLEEMISVIHHKMGLDLNPKTMSAKFTPNVRSAQLKLLRIMPLFIKNFAMKLVYSAVGERKTSICMSNLGVVTIPPEMEKHISRIDFLLGVQAEIPCICGVLSYNGKLYINFTRKIAESDLERNFFTTLRKLGAHVYIESNGGN